MTSELKAIMKHLERCGTTRRLNPVPARLRPALFTLRDRWLEARKVHQHNVELSPWLLSLLKLERGFYGYEKASRGGAGFPMSSRGSPTGARSLES